MIIRLKISHDAGKLRDVEPVAARAMLADGRAELPYADQLPQPEVAEPVQMSPHAVMGGEFMPGATRKLRKAVR